MLNELDDEHDKQTPEQGKRDMQMMTMQGDWRGRQMVKEKREKRDQKVWEVLNLNF